MAADPPAPALTPSAQRRLDMVRELAQLGMAVARALAEQAIRHAAANPPAPDGPDPTLALTRIARCIRQTLALEARFERPTPLLPSAAEQARTRRRTTEIRRKVEHAIEARAPAAETERLLQDLDENLENPAFLAAIATRPIAEIVRHLCEQIGLPGAACMTDAELAAWLDQCDTDEAGATPHPPPPDS